MAIRILVVDDSEVVRRGVAGILSARSDCEICGVARSGEEAMEKAPTLAPNLILLDISMPGMNGLEAARRLRDKLPETRILLMSQHDPDRVLPRAIEAGANGCIDKTRLAADLTCAIESLDVNS